MCGHRGWATCEAAQHPEIVHFLGKHGAEFLFGLVMLAGYAAAFAIFLLGAATPFLLARAGLRKAGITLSKDDITTMNAKQAGVYSGYMAYKTAWRMSRVAGESTTMFFRYAGKGRLTRRWPKFRR